MRYVVVLIVGLLTGAIAATTSARILAQRNPYPKALMTVMKHEMAAANQPTGQPDCNRGGNALEKLSLLADDIGTAMPDDGPRDRVFHQYIDNLSRQIARARQTGCAQRTEAMTRIKNACEDCHRDYR